METVVILTAASLDDVENLLGRLGHPTRHGWTVSFNQGLERLYASASEGPNCDEFGAVDVDVDALRRMATAVLGDRLVEVLADVRADAEFVRYFVIRVLELGNGLAFDAWSTHPWTRAEVVMGVTTDGRRFWSKCVDPPSPPPSSVATHLQLL